MDSQDLSSLVRRVIGRVLADRGLESGPFERRTGVHVTVSACDAPERPNASPAEESPGRGRGLVTAHDLDETPAGGRFDVPAGTIVTPLAAEEAARRDIRLARGPAGLVTGRSGSSLRVAVGCDHGGYESKRAVLDFVRELGHVPVDLGTHDETAVDYPDFARAVADAVANRQVDYGIVLDGAGIGSAMAANKVPGVRAANCWNEAAARNAREHNYANVLTLGARMHSVLELRAIVIAFLSTPEGPARHARRVAKITEIERRHAPRARGGAS